MTATLVQPSSCLSVARQFAEQLLRCAEDEALSPEQQGELVAWAREHLLSAYVVLYADKHLDPAVTKQLVCPSCGSAIGTIANMLDGALPLEAADLTFHCPPQAGFRAEAMRAQVSAWVRSQIALAARRVRRHTDEELAALREAVEAHFVVSAIRRFELAESMEVDVPESEELEVTTHLYLSALLGGRGLTWTPEGVVVD